MRLLACFTSSVNSRWETMAMDFLCSLVVLYRARSAVLLASPVPGHPASLRPRTATAARRSRHSRPCAREHPPQESLAQTPAVGLAPVPATMTMTMTMHAAGLRMFCGSHLAALPCLQRMGSAAAFARGLTTGAYGRRVYLVPGIKHIAANMSSTSSQRGYPARRGSAANMSSTSSQRGYPARKSEPWTRLTHQERRPQWVAYNPRTMRPPPLTTDTSSMKILSWNVNGLQTMVQSGFSADELVGRENFDVLCLQETHLEERNVDLFKNLVPEYDYTYWSCSVARLGYSGTAVISRVQPISVQYGLGIPEHDQEGRLITLEFDNFYLVNAYIPNSGRGLRRLNYRVNEWDPCFSDFIKKLECSKPVIVAGDLNCARESIDIHNPQAKTEAAGFTVEERESFEENLSSKGLIDTFRKQHPNAVAYTFWGENQRITNKAGDWITFLRQSLLPTRSMIPTLCQMYRSAITVQLALC